MKRNLMAGIMCLLLAIVLPLSAMAQTSACQTLLNAREAGKEIAVTLSAELGEELASDATISMLFERFALRLSAHNQKGALAVILDDKPAVEAAFRIAREGLMIKVTDEIMQDVAIVRLEDIKTLLTSLLAITGMDSENVSSVLEAVDNIFLGEEPANDDDTDMTVVEEKLGKYLNAFADDEAFMKWIEKLPDRMEITEGEFTSDKHDPAVMSVAITLTQDDMLTVLDSKLVKTILEEMVPLMNAMEDDDDEKISVDEHIKEARALFEKSKVDMPMTVYVDKDDNPVCVTMPAKFVMTVTETDDGETEEETVTMFADMNVNVKHTDEGARATYDMTMTVEDEDDDEAIRTTAEIFKSADVMSFDIKISSTDDHVFGAKGELNHAGGEGKGSASFYSAHEGKTNAIVFDYSHKVVSDSEVDAKLGVSIVSGGASAKAEPLVTFNAKVEALEPSPAFAALDATAPDKAVDVLKLSPEDMGKLFENAQNVLLDVLKSLN